jgi:hypothetical protein
LPTVHVRFGLKAELKLDGNEANPHLSRVTSIMEYHTNRHGLENFAITIIRRAALKLEAYGLTASPNDNLDDFLAWNVGRAAARAAAQQS